MRQEIHICVEKEHAGLDAVSILSQASELPKGRIKFAMQQGAVWMTRGKQTQRLRRVKKAVNVGDELHVYYDEQLLNQQAPEPTLVADEGDYSVWNKPYGMLSQGSKWGDHMALGRWVERHHTPQRNAFIVHRLDRAANGLMIIAHTKSAAAWLSKLFQTRDITKKYRASVYGHFAEYAKTHSDSESPLTVSFDQPIDEKHAVSHARVIDYDATENVSYLEVAIETGRKHQIRKHLSNAGFPIVGDRLYGRETISDTTPDLQLQAFYLTFMDPKKNRSRQYELAK
ncbi:MAG: RNA pseudouridine synthase [Pseudomonadota bacterium]